MEVEDEELQKAIQESLQSLKPAVQGVQAWHYRDMTRATNNFAPLLKLGQGGFGPVYRGRLAEQVSPVSNPANSSLGTSYSLGRAVM